MEHRHGVRTQIDIAVRLAGNSLTVLDGRLVDISVSGAFIASACPVKRLTCLDVQVLVSRGLRHTSLRIPAYVVRRGEDGIGVEWFEFASPAVREVLRAAVAPREDRSLTFLPPGPDPLSRLADDPL